jgi:hypothetical protein
MDIVAKITKGTATAREQRRAAAALSACAGVSNRNLESDWFRDQMTAKPATE